MTNAVFLAFLATLCTWGVTALGAAMVFFFKKTNQTVLSLMLGFAAGVMIAASFWSLLQPAVEQAKSMESPAWLVATVGFVLGALFLCFSDRMVARMRRRTEDQDTTRELRIRKIIMLVFSITLHNIPEGLAVGVAFGALASGHSPEILMAAISIAFGIALQNFPEGAAISLPLRREGFSRRKSFLIGQASAIVEPIAGVLGALLVVRVKAILPFALSFAAGAMILVAVHELIPDCHESNSMKGYLPTAGIIGGFAVMMLLDVMLG